MTSKITITTCFLFVFSSLLIAQSTSVPDVAFENYLETHTMSGLSVSVGDEDSMGDGVLNNGLVLTDRIIEVVSLSLVQLNIENLTGIEDFTSLEILVVNNNRLEVIDVSLNTNLKILNVSDNRISGELVVSNNFNLEGLFCSYNQISTLNLSDNHVLRDLSVRSNALTDLDLSTINSAVCPNPQTDPVTTCQGTGSIDVSENQLTSLVVNNGFNELFTFFNASDNPELSCIQIDSGFEPSVNWFKDDWAYYTDGICADIYTYVPDDSFEQALIDLGYDNVLDNLVLTNNINAETTLDISNKTIADLTGIEDFLALQILDIGFNNLETIDYSSNINLTELDVSNNNLEALDLSENTSLTILYCESNLLENLEIDNLAALQILNCSNNLLNALDSSGNTQLNDLDISFNQIESLNVTMNPSLVSLQCNDNSLFALNLANGNNNNISTLSTINNSDLSCIEVDNVVFANSATGWQKDATANYNLDCGTYVPDDNFEQALINLGVDSDNTLNNYVPTADVINYNVLLDISGLNIADLTGIKDFISLQALNCSNNNLEVLDLSSNLALVNLDCSLNQIEILDLNTNTNLTSVSCSDNELKSLNIENGNNNNLNTFDSINNQNLFCINVDDAIIGNIPSAWQKDDFAVYNGDCNNSRITIIPDAFFEQALIDLGIDDTIDGQVLTANIEQVQTLIVNNKNISDLTGVQDFKSLIELDCSGNFLDQLDASNLLFLERLSCGSNFLLTNDTNNTEGLFNTSNTPNLRELYCADNSLNDLDTSLNLNLDILDCADNDLTVLNVQGNISLRNLNCSNNELTDLNIGNNNSLEVVNCDSNQIENLITASAANNSLTSLSCSNNGITNLSIENYQVLSRLNSNSNQLENLNVQNNTELEYLSLSVNQISNIDISNNPVLEELLVSQNQLSNLNVSSNLNLNHLNCDFNQLANIDLTSNTLLERLYCSNNELITLNLAVNYNLIEANLSANAISNLVLSSDLSLLKDLNASNNQIETGMDLTSFAISACMFLPNQENFCSENISINVSNNLLDFVNIQNGINQDITSFNASGNPSLECIQVDDLDNVPTSWLKDEATTYSIDCNFGETFVPDDNFEQALINLGLDSGPLNDYVPTSAIQALINLDVSGNSISDMTGLDDFNALQNLNCSNNSLMELDVSSNGNLQVIDCSNNNIEELLVETNVNLSSLNCSNNNILDLELIANESLTELNISNNGFTIFSPAEVLSLQTLNAKNNAIIELDFQQNLNLSDINCQFNQLEILNIRNGQNTELIDLNAQNNPGLLCIESDTGNIPSGANWLIDETTSLAIECNFGETFVPDDSFEEALINLGFDTGVADDYVPTENIENLSFLDVSEYEISDLTGIEDFESLTTLNVSDNELSTVDLSSNILLVNLRASNNAIEELDISQLPELVNLSLGDNNLQQLDLNANANIKDLDVSNNQLTSINLFNQALLENLDCGSNQIESLNLSQNPNLNLLFCQTNALFGDQLNIQNGNNTNLIVFNATNNPALGCILVDNPVAVINNSDGTYDNWVKDESATYQTICEDADNDGIPNEDDLCPATEFGATVDLFGCAVPNFATDNFTVSITDETCLNSNDGKIRIVAQDILFYTATLTGNNFSQAYNFTNDVDIFNLLAGTYEMCITVEEWPNYELCYSIVITSPNPLEVFESTSELGDVLNLYLSGNNLYNITFNNESYSTQNSRLTLNLKQGLNTIKISTDLSCQGVYEKSIYFGSNSMVYPNPFINSLNVQLGNVSGMVNINIYSIIGQLVLSEKVKSIRDQINLNVSGLSAGVYLMEINIRDVKTVHKIIKE